LLVVIDGAKALSSAVKAVFGAHAVNALHARILERMYEAMECLGSVPERTRL
jgi:hypothetical protein